MQALSASRACYGIRSVPRRSLVCRAEVETSKPVTTSTRDNKQSLKAPEWLPGSLVPYLEFFSKEDFNLKDTAMYQNRLKPYVENDTFEQSFGWKQIPETINGRAAMLGFVAAAGAEIFGAGSVLRQLAAGPQIVVGVLALIAAATIIPVYKGTKGDYLDSLRDTYSLPEGVFTPALEKLHGRIAMVGLGTLITLEVLLNRALL